LFRKVWWGEEQDVESPQKKTPERTLEFFISEKKYVLQKMKMESEKNKGILAASKPSHLEGRLVASRIALRAKKRS
jgi:hypothetical protein